MKQAIVSIMGMPGAGKSTLASLLANYGLSRINAGDVARKLAETDAETAANLARGDIAPPEKMNVLLKQTVYDAACTGRSVVVEGFPRYTEQYNDLTSIALPRDAFYFIVLGSNDSVSKNRMLSRGRADDNDAAIKNRIEYFWKSTYPMIQDIASNHPGNVLHVPIGSPADTFNYTAAFLNAAEIIEWPRYTKY